MKGTGVYTILVGVAEFEKLEKNLNRFRIGLNDWDKTKIFNVSGCEVIHYTIICDEETFISLTKVVNGTRIY